MGIGSCKYIRRYRRWGAAQLASREGDARDGTGKNEVAGGPRGRQREKIGARGGSYDSEHGSEATRQTGSR